jgi:hypothetical protein
MQIATIAPKPPVRELLGPDTAPNGNHGPIGVSSFGTLRIGHALNGIAYSEHHLIAPLSAPLAQYTGSLQDAIAGARRDIMKLQLAGGSQARIAVALTGMGNRWMAHQLFGDPTVVRAIDNGAGHGGIASIEFTSVSRSLGALVTSGGSLIPSQYPAQGAPKA